MLAKSKSGWWKGRIGNREVGKKRARTLFFLLFCSLGAVSCESHNWRKRGRSFVIAVGIFFFFFCFVLIFRFGMLTFVVEGQ